MEGNIYKNIEPNFYAHVQAALFTVAKRQKQPKCPSVEEWINKVKYPYSGILLSHKRIKA